jgi:hypothetical protein
MHPPLSQFSEHGATPAVAASAVHTYLLVELTKLLLDCLTAESSAFLAGWQWRVRRCFSSVLPHILRNLLPQLLTYHSLLTLCAFGLPSFQQNRVLCLSIAAYHVTDTQTGNLTCPQSCAVAEPPITVYLLAKQMGTSVKMIEHHYGHYEAYQKADTLSGWRQLD